MKLSAKVLVLIFFSLFVFCGCNRAPTQPVYRTVTQVDVVTEYKDQLIHRHYNTPEKMRPMLLYLRLLKPYGKPVQPNEADDNVFLISISLSDGRQHYYRQASHRYFSKGNGPWKHIDPGQAAQLYDILRQLPSDL